jgi:hypothetical protein
MAKKKFGSTKGTVKSFIDVNGGIPNLDARALVKKFGREERTMNKWAEELKRLTIIKTINSKLLSSEV